MQRRNNISTESTSLSRHTTSPAEWSEEQKRAYLIQINERENPTELPRLQYLFDQNHSADEIAKLCNEHGHLTYKSLQDPNALINRFNFVSLKNPYVITDIDKSTYDADYYFPSIQSIHQTRELVAAATKGHEILKDQPKLVTAEDYRKYFASFDPATFEILIREMHVLEITKGCNGPCRAVCVTMAEGPVSATLPYEIVIELIDAHYRVSDKPLSLYYANDIADYRDGDKTGADVYKYLMSKHEKNKNFTHIFTVYSLRPSNIDFIYRCITENLPIYRISHIVAGNKPGDLGKLLEKLEERAGKPLSAKEKNTVQEAFAKGESAGKILTLGNAVKTDTPESEISSEAINTTHEVAFKTGSGFMGQIVRPPSKKYPSGEMIWPIAPNAKDQIIPEAIGMAANSSPLRRHYDGFYQRPRFIRVSNGTITKDESTYEEKRLEYFSLLNREFNETKNARTIGKKIKMEILMDKMREAYMNSVDGRANISIHLLKKIASEIQSNIRNIKNISELIQETADMYSEDQIAMDDMLYKIEKIYRYYERLKNAVEEMTIRLTLLISTPETEQILKQSMELEEILNGFEPFLLSIFKPNKK